MTKTLTIDVSDELYDWLKDVYPLDSQKTTPVQSALEILDAEHWDWKKHHGPCKDGCGKELYYSDTGIGICGECYDKRYR